MADRNEDLRGQHGPLTDDQGAIVIDDPGAERGPLAVSRTFLAIGNGRRFGQLLTGTKSPQVVPAIHAEAQEAHAEARKADNHRWRKGLR